MDESMGNIEKKLSDVVKEKSNLEEKLNGIVEQRKSNGKKLEEDKALLNQLIDQQMKFKESLQVAKTSSNAIETETQSLDSSIKRLSAKISQYEEALNRAKEQNLKLLDRFEDEIIEMRQLFLDSFSGTATEQLAHQFESFNINSLNSNNSVNGCHTQEQNELLEIGNISKDANDEVVERYQDLNELGHKHFSSIKKQEELEEGNKELKKKLGK